MSQNLATTTTLAAIKAQILGQLGAISAQETGILNLEMNDLVHQAIMSIRSAAGKLRDDFYSTNDSITFAGTTPDFSVSVATKAIANLRAVTLYHAALGEIPIVNVARYNAWRTRYRTSMGATDAFAKISSAIGVSDSSPGGNFGASAMSFTAATKVFTGTMTTPFAVTDIGKRVVFRKSSTSYEGKIAQFLTTTTVVLSGLALPATDQAAVDAAIVVDDLAVSAVSVLTVYLFSGAATAPTSVELAYPRFPSKITVEADTLDAAEIDTPLIRDLGTIYVAKRLARQPSADVVASTEAQIKSLYTQLGIPDLTPNIQVKQ